MVGLLVYSYSHHWLAPGAPASVLRPVLNGAVFGAGAVWLMVARIELVEGEFVDARSVPIALIGLFEGPVAALVAAAPAVGYRAWMGGSGAPAGIAALVTVAGAAAAAHAWARREGGVGWRHAAVLAAAVFVVTFLSFVVLGPREAGKFSRHWVAYLAICAIGIAVVARLFRDVGDRARLAVERARFRAIIDEATDAIRIVDAETLRIVDANAADGRLAGYDRTELIGRDVRTLWPDEPDLRREHEALDAELRAQGHARGFGIACRTRTGALVRLDLTRRLVTHGGRGWEIVVARDAAEREAAESAVREATELRAVNLLAATTAHEINNPLAVVVGALDLVRRTLPAGGREWQLIDRAMAATTRIRDIVVRLTQIRRIEQGEGRAGLPPVLDLERSTATPADERQGDDRWRHSSTPSSS